MLLCWRQKTKLQGPDDFLDVCFSVIKKLTAQLEQDDCVLAVCSCCASGNLLLLDNDNKPITPIIGWQTEVNKDDLDSFLTQEEQDAVAQQVSGLNPVGITQNCGQQSDGVHGSPPWRDTRFTASDIEFHLEPPLYTYNTLERLSQEFPDKNFALLMGGDNISILHKWYRGEELLQKYPILVYPREGVDTEAICKEKGAIFIDAPQVNVSSTQIRNMQASGEDVSHLRY